MGADAKTAMKVEVTEAAASRVAKIVAGEPGKIALRVSVEGGGCSGFSYKFDLVDARNDDDVAIEKNGATVLIDDLSLVYMGGSGDRLRRRSDGPVLPDQEPERRRFLRLRDQLLDIIMPTIGAVRQVALSAGRSLDATLAFWSDVLGVPLHARYDPPGHRLPARR